MIKTKSKLKYKILTKSKKFCWTVNSRIYPILVLTTLLLLIKQILFKNQNITLFDKSLMFILFLTIFSGLIIGKFKKYQTLKGQLISDLEFKKNKILIDDKEYLLDDIQKIEIKAFDFIGAIANHKGIDFDGNLSNGVNNFLKVYMKNQNKIELNFQQIKKNEIRNDEDIFINYCNNNKLHYLNLLEILGIDDYDEIQRFKMEKLTNT